MYKVGRIYPMKPEDLRQLLARPESEELQFKSRLPHAGGLARLMSAFANTNGGTLVIGAREGGEIVGVDDPDAALFRLEQAINLVSPRVHVQTETVRIDGKSVLIVSVPKGHELPYLAAGTALQRSGALAVPITSEALYSRIREHATSPGDLRTELQRICGIVETLNRQVIESRSWRAKVPEMILGGIIGAVISFLISWVITYF